jgi:hypothetical protein
LRNLAILHADTDAAILVIARHFLQRLAIGRDRLRELPRPALPLAENPKRSAEIHLRRGAIGRDRSVSKRCFQFSSGD